MGMDPRVLAIVVVIGLTVYAGSAAVKEVKHVAHSVKHAIVRVVK